MGFELDTDELAVEMEGFGRDQAMEAANRAFSASQENLTAAGDAKDYETFPVVQSGQPPTWDSGRGAAVFGYSHEASNFFEYGTQTHEVVAEGETLVFEWPEAPPEVQEMFESSFPTVFFPQTEPSGIDQIGYVRGGLRDAKYWLEGSR